MGQRSLIEDDVISIDEEDDYKNQTLNIRDLSKASCAVPRSPPLLAPERQLEEAGTHRFADEGYEKGVDGGDG